MEGRPNILPCRRCGSVKGIGKVKTMSPTYGEVWDEPSQKWKQRGFSKQYHVCMACILKIESWVEGKDQRLPGQEQLQDFIFPPLTLLRWFVETVAPS
jgi:hypothetical protein